MNDTPANAPDARARVVRYPRVPETDETFAMSLPERLSAIFDAEATATDLDAVLAAWDAEPALGRTWASHVATADALAGRPGLGRVPVNFAAGVMAAIGGGEADTARAPRVVPLAARRPATPVSAPRPPLLTPAAATLGVPSARRRVSGRRRFATAISGAAAAAALCVGAGYWLGQARPALADGVATAAPVASPAGSTVWASAGSNLRTVSERADYSRDNGWQRMPGADAAPMDAATAAQLSRLLMNHAAARTDHGGMMGAALVYVRDNAGARDCLAQAAC